MQVEAADRRSSTMGFIWAGTRALRRNHLGRFMKLRSETAWLEGTLFEMDNPGQSGNFFAVCRFSCLNFLLAAPKRFKPSDGIVADEAVQPIIKAEPEVSAAAAATPAANPAEAAPATESAPQNADSNAATTMQ